MKIGLIGMSGTGKTTLLNQTTGLIKLPEVARGFLNQESLFKDAGYELNMQSICVANWQHIDIMNANPLLSFITDRTIVDDLALMVLYFKKEFDLSLIQQNIDNKNLLSGDDFLYDELIIIKNSTDEDFINTQILSDKQRKNSKQYDVYINNANEFYRLVELFLTQLTGIAKTVTYKKFGELTPSYFE